MATKQQARQELVKRKLEMRQRTRERDERIEGAVVDVLVQLDKRTAAEEAAGRAVERLAAEGLKAAEVAEWCGLSLVEVARLRAVVRKASDNEAPATRAPARNVAMDSEP